MVSDTGRRGASVFTLGCSIVVVELRLLNGLGNILVQYAYARIVAESKDYALSFCQVVFQWPVSA